MKCSDLLGNLGFECTPVGANTLRVWSPFTYGNDGEQVGVYVEKFANGYLVSDNAEAIMHATSLGISISKKRLASLRNIAGPSVKIADGGEITAAATADNVPEAVAHVLNAAMGVSHFEGLWQPRQRGNADFARRVGAVLDDSLGENRINRNVSVVGASGHQIEIPFVIDHSPNIYVQPVAYGDDRVDWDNVYRGLGKMIDLKNAGTSDFSRVIVLEDPQRDVELTNAISLLSFTASVVNFSKLGVWAKKMAA